MPFVTFKELIAGIPPQGYRIEKATDEQRKLLAEGGFELIDEAKGIWWRMKEGTREVTSGELFPDRQGLEKAADAASKQLPEKPHSSCGLDR